MLFGSSASISSWSSVSSFDHASGFLDSTKGSILSNKNDKTKSYVLSDLSCTSSEQDSRTRLLVQRTSSNKHPHDISKTRSVNVPSYDPVKETNREKNRNDASDLNNKTEFSSIKTKEKESVNSNFELNVKGRKKIEKNEIFVSSSSPKYKATKNNLDCKRTDGNKLIPQELIKELYIVQKVKKGRKGNSGKCVVCSASYSIPYIEKHILDKHQTILQKASTNESVSRKDASLLSHSSYIRPRVVITKLISPTESTEKHSDNTTSINANSESKCIRKKTVKSNLGNQVKDSKQNIKPIEKPKTRCEPYKNLRNKSSEKRCSKLKSTKNKKMSQVEELSTAKKDQSTKKPAKNSITSKEKSHREVKKQEAHKTDKDDIDDKLPEKVSTGKF